MKLLHITVTCQTSISIVLNTHTNNYIYSLSLSPPNLQRHNHRLYIDDLHNVQFIFDLIKLNITITKMPSTVAKELAVATH